MIEIGRAIQHPFEDKDWVVKMIVGAGVSLVPILNFALIGYGLEVQRRAALGQDVPMPHWGHLEKYLVDGLKIVAVQLLYVVPIAASIFGIILLGTAFGIGSVSITASPATRSDLSRGFMTVIIGMASLILLYILVYVCVMPALYVQIARTGQINAAFNFKQIVALIQSRTGDYFLVVFVSLLIVLGFGMVFGVMAFIPTIGLCITFLVIPMVFVINPYLTIVCGYLYGQLMRP